MSILTDKIVARFNSENLIKLEDKESFLEVKSWASCGSPELDYNLRILGLPNGIIEIAGKSRSGKTTLALMAMKNFQAHNPDGVCVILSSENRDNKELAVNIGLDTAGVIVYKIRYLETMFLNMKLLIDNANTIAGEEGLPAPKFCFFWDALGSTLTKAEIDTMEENAKQMEKRIDKGNDGEGELKHAKMMDFARTGKMFGKWVMQLNYTNTVHMIMLNHYYDKVTGHGTKSTGGEWVELFPTLRLKTVFKEHIKVDEVQVAQITTVKVEKNDFGSRKETDIEILMGYGIVLSEMDLQWALENEIINREGKTKLTAFGGKLSWSTKRQYYDLYTSGNKLMKVLHNKVLKARHEEIIKEKGFEGAIKTTIKVDE